MSGRFATPGASRKRGAGCVSLSQPRTNSHGAGRAGAVIVPTSLKFTVPLILLGFAATLSAVNLLYHVPQAERAAEEDSRKRMAQEMSRLQSTLEYLLLKGDISGAAQHEIAVLAHNHDVSRRGADSMTATS